MTELHIRGATIIVTILQLKNRLSMANTKEILDAVQAKLAIARRGWSDMKDPTRFQMGLWNAVVFGRNSTFTLQNLRNKVGGFDKWYGPKQEQMRQDPVMAYFVKLRNNIEKSIVQPGGASAYVNSFDRNDLRRMGKPPPGAKGFFIGDQFGGSGWQVLSPDGSIEHFYVTLPPDIGVTTVILPDAPGDGDAHRLTDEYLTKLELIAREACDKFMPTKS